MQWIQKNILTLVLLLLVYGGYFIFQQVKPTPNASHVLGAQTNLSLFEQPTDGRQPLLNAIDNSQHTILMEIYMLTDKQIISSLVQAEGRGVEVKVLLEQHPFGAATINQNTKKTLDAAHVATEWTNPSFALTHEKGIIIDNSELFILNQNLTAASFKSNREYDIIDRNAVDVQEAEQIFSADWNRQSYTPPVSHIVLSPINSRSSLTQLLSGATKTIDIEMEIVQDKDMLSVLENKEKTTLIRVIIPTLAKDPSNADAMQALQNAGIQVRTISSPYIHAKLIVTDDNQAYVGSVNFSSASMDENRELGIILTQNDIVQELEADFSSDWERGQ